MGVVAGERVWEGKRRGEMDGERESEKEMEEKEMEGAGERE